MNGSPCVYELKSSERVAVLDEAVGPRLGTQVERRVDGRVLVDRPQGHLAEASVDEAGSELRRRVGGVRVRVDVHDRAGVDLGAGLRVVVRGAPRLDDQLPDEAVAPVVDAVDVRVPEDVVELDVRDTSGTARTPRRRTDRPRGRSSSGLVSVIVFAAALIDAIWRISMLSVARPAAIHSPTWNFATLER